MTQQSIGNCWSQRGSYSSTISLSIIFSVHDYFSFGSELSKFNSKNLIASLDVESLFNNNNNIVDDLVLTTDIVDILKGKNLNNSGVFTKFDSFIPISYKYGLVNTLIFRCSFYEKLHNEIVYQRHF